ncbi:putative rhamnosyl transferase [Aquiflexum gelatinilyticum]|uniref:putative rhamnosyl transferase n=1 Tax=Aquiflexum gelatinilyticum TaxID=2961943 RepID=UPI00216769CE|nr:putative rhamnosyl transferase [Aquiflexum gelatinilyticum]MCS4434554.1 putative rhamnosyl transferase [Aquiflexum gelatinilyticum]
MKLKYILITRFNLDYKRIVSETLGINPDEWLKNRIDLFFDYCYPSVLNQSDKNFEWWVFFDFQTDKKILDVLREKDRSGLIKFKFSTWAGFREDILSELKNIPDNYDYLMNARLDSDDALSKFNVEEIKKYFLSRVNLFPESFILNPLSGLIFDTSTTILYRKKLNNNPFQVLVQKQRKIVHSVFTFQHQSVSNHLQVFNISSIPFWLVVVHGGNWLNVKSGRPIILKKKILKKYFSTITFPESEISSSRMLKEFQFFFKSIQGKVLSRLKASIGNFLFF